MAIEWRFQYLAVVDDGEFSAVIDWNDFYQSWDWFVFDGSGEQIDQVERISRHQNILTLEMAQEQAAKRLERAIKEDRR